MHDVLLVERDPFFANIFSSLLEFYELQAIKCTNPDLILDFFERTKYKIVLVSFNDSDENIVINLNKILVYKPTIIILHSYYDKQLEEEPFFDYVYAYLVKPKGIVHLKEILYSLFDKKVTVKKRRKIEKHSKRVVNY